MLEYGDGIPKIPLIWVHTLMSLVLLFHFAPPRSSYGLDSHRSRILHKLQQFGVHPDTLHWWRRRCLSLSSCASGKSRKAPGLADKAQAVLFQAKDLKARLAKVLALLTSKAEAFDRPGRCLPDLRGGGASTHRPLPSLTCSPRPRPNMLNGGVQNLAATSGSASILSISPYLPGSRSRLRPEGRQNRHPVEGHGLRKGLPGLREKLGEGWEQVVSSRAALRPVLLHAGRSQRPPRLLLPQNDASEHEISEETRARREVDAKGSSSTKVTISSIT